MRNLGVRNFWVIGASLLVAMVLIGDAKRAEAQVYYVPRPVAYDAYPTYTYYGGWYPGSYMNNYGNYGS